MDSAPPKMESIPLKMDSAPLTASPLVQPVTIIALLVQIYELILSIIKIIAEIQLLCGATLGRSVVQFFRVLVALARFTVRLVYLFLPGAGPFEAQGRAAIKDTVKDAVTAFTNEAVQAAVDDITHKTSINGTTPTLTANDVSMPKDTESTAVVTGSDAVVKAA